MACVVFLFLVIYGGTAYNSKIYKQSGTEDLAYKRETGVWENI